jgi:hypothetical protein
MIPLSTLSSHFSGSSCIRQQNKNVALYTDSVFFNLSWKCLYQPGCEFTQILNDQLRADRTTGK